MNSDKTKFTLTNYQDPLFQKRKRKRKREKIECNLKKCPIHSLLVLGELEPDNQVEFFRTESGWATFALLICRLGVLCLGGGVG